MRGKLLVTTVRVSWQIHIIHRQPVWRVQCLFPLLLLADETWSFVCSPLADGCGYKWGKTCKNVRFVKETWGKVRLEGLRHANSTSAWHLEHGNNQVLSSTGGCPPLLYHNPGWEFFLIQGALHISTHPPSPPKHLITCIICQVHSEYTHFHQPLHKSTINLHCPTINHRFLLLAKFTSRKFMQSQEAVLRFRFKRKYIPVNRGLRKMSDEGLVVCLPCDDKAVATRFMFLLVITQFSS